MNDCIGLIQQIEQQLQILKTSLQETTSLTYFTQQANLSTEQMQRLTAHLNKCQVTPHQNNAPAPLHLEQIFALLHQRGVATHSVTVQVPLGEKLPVHLSSHLTTSVVMPVATPLEQAFVAMIESFLKSDRTYFEILRLAKKLKDLGLEYRKIKEVGNAC